MNERHNEFIDTLHGEGNGEFVARTAVALNAQFDTALFLLRTHADETSMLVGRATNLATDDERMLLQLQVFRDEQSPIVCEEFAIPLNELRLQAVKPLPFDEFIESDETRKVLAGRSIYGGHPIYFAELDEERRVGTGDYAFIPGGSEDEGGRVKHLSGIVVSFFRRKGKESDGEDLAGQDVTEVRVIHPDPDVETEHFVDLSENVEIEGRAGNRFVITRRVAGAAGAAAVVSAGAVAAAYRVGKSRFRR